MTNIPKKNIERASGCKGYCDGGNNGAKIICNSNCRKLNLNGDKSEKEFQYSKDEIKKIKYIFSRYEKYITPKNINNYLFVAEINREINLILDK